MKGFVALLCLLAVTPMALAGAYRWVDENGQTHFADRPPTHVASDEVALPQGPATPDEASRARKQRMNDFLERSERERAERNTQAEKEEARAAKQKTRCDALRARQKHLKSISGLYRLNSDGERVFVDDAENEKIRRDFAARVRRECGA